MIFDFDFTLVDSSAGVVECVGLALAELGFNVPSRDRILRTIGLSLSDTFYHLTGDTSQASAYKFSRRFLEHADNVMEANTVVYPAVGPVLQRLRAHGLQTGIVSTKYRSRMVNILRTNGVRDQFDVIVGAEDVTRHKPDPSGILLALERLSATPDVAIYIGDHVVDAIAAAAAGVPFIATLSGMHARAAFKTHPHRTIVNGIAALPRALGI